MADLDAAERKNLPKSDFGEPAERKYPMPDKSHAVDAKGRAKQMLKRGTISQAAYDKICAKADRVLGEKGGSKSDKPEGGPKTTTRAKGADLSREEGGDGNMGNEDAYQGDAGKGK